MYVCTYVVDEAGQCVEPEHYRMCSLTVECVLFLQVVDEAGQCVEPEVLIAVRAADSSGRYRMCSLSLLQNVFSCYRMCWISSGRCRMRSLTLLQTLQNVFSDYRMCCLWQPATHSPRRGPHAGAHSEKCSL